MQTDVLIIGGGLAGLALADGLARTSIDFHLVEGRPRFGGRILTQTEGAGYFDLGPAWFWPGQPRMDALVSRHGLQRFVQFSDGLLTQEDANGHVLHGSGPAAMQGSWRLEGGFGKLVHTLANGPGADRLELNAKVTELHTGQDHVTATLASGEKILASRVVLALPPRVAAGIGTSPPLPQTALDAMKSMSTWMAGQAKALAVYDKPFWRNAGLSGDAMSRHGPMVEIHDASPAVHGPYGLFGFIGVPPQHRRNEPRLRQAVLSQLVRLFGNDAATPQNLYIKDWAQDEFTSTDADCLPVCAHPRYGLPQALKGHWQGKLLFGGSEVAEQFGGYLEGALEAAGRVLHELLK